MRGSGGFLGLWCSGWRARWSVRVPDGLSAVAARGRCRATAVVTNAGSDSVSTGVAVTPDGKTAFVASAGIPFGSGNSVSTIDVKTRTKNLTDITVGAGPFGVVFTPCRR
jgi:YVTN family beta-propeller protein